jgi:plasmid stability protein
MASLIIRKLDDTVKQRLRVRAAQNGRSMEEEAREILTAGLSQGSSQQPNLFEAIRKVVEPLGGIE